MMRVEIPGRRGRLYSREPIDRGIAARNLSGSAGFKKARVLARARISSKQAVEIWVPWSSLILEHSRQGRYEEAARILGQIASCSTEIVPSESLFVAVLNRLSSPRALEHGRKIHAIASSFNRVDSSRKIRASLLGMYVRCGGIEDVRKFFDSYADKDEDCWETLISIYAKRGWTIQALRLLRVSLLEGISPKEEAFIAALSACSTPSSLAHGKKIHRLLEECGGLLHESRSPVALAVAKMYQDCGSARGLIEELERRAPRSMEGLIRKGQK